MDIKTYGLSDRETAAAAMIFAKEEMTDGCYNLHSLIDNEGEDNEVDHREDIGAWYEMINPGITPEWVKHQAQGFIDDLDWKEWCIMGVYETKKPHEVCGIIAFKNYQ